MADESFPDAVRDRLGFLIGEHGFRIVEEGRYHVLLERPGLSVRATWDPRGEVDVYVFRPGQGSYGVWTYTGMVGRASVPRLLEIAGERMRADNRVLLGDTEYFEQLARDQQREAEELTDYASGRVSKRRRQHPLP